jgi:succinyl-CoA synthetase beta subunit
MLTGENKDILATAKAQGWVLEPEAKRLLASVGIDVPRFQWTTCKEDAVSFARDIGYPVVAKVVSPLVIHKSDLDGVAVGIGNDTELENAFDRFSCLDGFTGMLVEEMLAGVELIIGAKMDYQFGPVILLGIGGTGVEIYQDTSVRMAPLRERDVVSMLRGLKARDILAGYRGSEPVDRQKLTQLLMIFSDLVVELQETFESIDLNPVICTGKRCIVADARIMLNET